VLLGAKPGTKPVKTSKILYVSNQISNTISVFGVSSKGALSLVKGSPFPILGTVFPAGMDTSPDGSLLYVSNGNNAVNVFSVSSKGVLTEVAGSPFPTGQFGLPLSLAAFPSRACK
jgi:6-phosphogluconolactonase